jgi:purine-binding chemotaxis protein CheW
LPNAPAVVLGALDIEGTILPVLSLRRRLELPDREIAVTDHFLVADTARRTVILVIDAPQGVRKVRHDQVTRGTEVVPGLGAHLHGVLALEDGLVLIHDLEAFLSLEEEAALDTALAAEEGTHGN